MLYLETFSNNQKYTAQHALTRSKSKIETQEKGVNVKHTQS